MCTKHTVVKFDLTNQYMATHKLNVYFITPHACAGVK